MSYLLEALGRGLLVRLSDAFAHHLPTTDDDDLETLQRRRAQASTSVDLAVREGAMCLRDLRLHTAERAFRDALALDNTNRPARIGLACVCDELGQAEEARHYLAEAHDLDSGDPALAFALGYCCERQGDTDTAAEHYRRAVELHPYLRNAHERLGALAIRRADWPAALAAYEQLIDLEPDDIDILTTHATLHLHQGDAAAAVDEYQRALLIEPECDGTLDEAEELCRAGRLDEAITAVQHLVQKFPGVPDFHVHLGDLYARAGDSRRAMAEYRTALDYHPNYLEATIKLGTHQLRDGQASAAAQSFARAAELNDRLITAFVGLGVAQSAAGDEAGATATFLLAANLEPNSTLLFSETARLHFRDALEREQGGLDPLDMPPPAQELLEEALRRHEQALHMRPAQADLHYRHGLLLRQAGEIQRAADAFGRAVAISPHYSKALIKYGITLKELGRDAEAIGAFERAMRLDDRSIELHYQLGLLFAQRNHFDLAVEEFEAAAGPDAGRAAFRDNLALVLQNIGMVDRAQATWRSICALSRPVPLGSNARESILRSLREH